MTRVSIVPRKSARLQAARGPKKLATTPAQKPRKSRSARGAPTSDLSTQKEDGFPFLSLPAEIQLFIFNIIFSHLPNHVLGKTPPPFTEPSAVRKREMIWIRAPHDASQFLLACRTIHKNFAPLYWQRSTVCFTDPIRLANEFLAFASPTAMANLSHLRYTVKTGGYQDPSYDNEKLTHIATRVKEVRKLVETVSLYRELKNLRSFQVVIALGATLRQLTEDIVWTGLEDRVEDRTWKVVYAKYRGCFEDLEKKMSRRTLRGFHMDKRVIMDTAAPVLGSDALRPIEVRPGWHYVRPVALRMTFSKNEA